MTQPSPQAPFHLAVLGDSDVLRPDDLSRLLDLLVSRYSQARKVCLVSVGGSPGLAWAQDRLLPVAFIPTLGNPVKRDVEILATAHAIVVLGEPGRWKRLLNLADQARTPTRVFRKAPHVPHQSPPMT